MHHASSSQAHPGVRWWRAPVPGPLLATDGRRRAGDARLLHVAPSEQPVRIIDLNADLGESYGSWVMGDDAGMLDIVTSANVACGFHAGDPRTIRTTVTMAADRGVVVGAHVGYHDLVGFGRRTIDVEPEALEADVLYQLGALDALCRAAGTRVRYVKAHGALYHRVNGDPVQAGALARAVAAFDTSLPLLGAAGPMVEAAREHGLATVGEGLPDRARRDDGSLVARTEPAAVLSDPYAVAAQALALASDPTVASVCVHGDTPNAVALARAVRSALVEHGHALGPFVTP